MLTLTQHIRDWLLDDLRRLAVVISLLLSLWIHLTYDTINSDGILYIDSAYQITLGNWKEAYALYQWTFYPALIAIFSTITFLEVTITAHTLNAVLYATIIWLFLTALKITGANRTVMIAGSIVILAHPYINDYRADILRGPGLWIALLLGLILLIRLKETTKIIYGLWWGTVMMTAILFRIEAIAYLVLGPLILAINQNHGIRTRIKIITSCYIVPAGLAAGILPIYFLGGKDIPIGRMLEPLELIEKLYTTLTVTIPAKASIISEQVLIPYSNDFGHVGVYVILLAIFIITTIKRATLLYSALALYNLYKRGKQPFPQYASILLWLLAINILYLAAFVIAQFYLSSRFAMPSALIIAIFASYGLAALFEKTTSTSWLKTSSRYLVVIIILIMTLDGLHSFGDSKRYLRDGGSWLQEHMQENEYLLTNHLVINHYAGKHNTMAERHKQLGFSHKLRQGKPDITALDNVDYLAIRTKHLSTDTINKIETSIRRKPVKIFTKKTGQELLIYHLSQNNPS